jgi:7-cyano-7-deazaguanine synthase
MKKQAVLSLSGGMDSSTLLLHLLANGYEVTALSFDYGQKHRVELERAQALVDYVNSNSTYFSTMTDGSSPTEEVQRYPKVKYGVIKLDGLSPMLNSALVEGGDEVPEGHYEQENMKATVVPNRNKIFSSIIQAVALSTSNEKDTEVFISLGIHAGDHAIYPDCRQEWRDIDHQAFIEGNWNSHKVKFYTPYLTGNKLDILKDGEVCCEKLGLDFNEVYKRTNTSYKPIYIPYPESTSRVEETLRTEWGEWYSDYKSASSVERVEAFISLGRPDPVEYADETGPVEWDTVVKHVKQVLNQAK